MPFVSVQFLVFMAAVAMVYFAFPAKRQKDLQAVAYMVDVYRGNTGSPARKL